MDLEVGLSFFSPFLLFFLSFFFLLFFLPFFLCLSFLFSYAAPLPFSLSRYVMFHTLYILSLFEKPGA